MQDNLIVFPEPPPDDKEKLDTHALPVSLTSLIGREQEVQAIEALLLRSDVHLLTLTGTAGVGKTRLALEVVRDMVGDFADGVQVVSLAPLSDPAFVIPTIAHTLGLTESGTQPVLDVLKSSQRDKQRLLLLDNFEHVIPAAPLLSELLEACPDLKLLVTSREVLHLRGEHQFAVLPLALPDFKHLPDAPSLAHVPAVKLFVQRAQAITPNFHLTADNASAIAQVCIRLDGLPLAIELAAARIKLLAPQALLARLDRRQHVLTGGARDLPERQQTLQNTLQWSYALLSEEEQRLFRRLAVFVGGCTLEAVEALCTLLGNDVTSVLDGVASLLDKSLLQHLEQRQDSPRLMMLETLREYGLEALVANEELEHVRQAHAHYYLALAEEAEPELVGLQQAEWLERLEREHDNMRAAMQWVLERGDAEQSMELALRLGGALHQFWRVRRYLSEGRTFLERALAGSKEATTASRTKALMIAARLAVLQADTERGEVLCEGSLALCRELRDTAGMAYTLHLLGIVACQRSELSKARSQFEESLALWRKVGDKNGIALALFYSASLALQQGEYSKARVLCEESLALSKQEGNKSGIALALFKLAQTCFNSQGDPASVRSLLEESLTLNRELGDTHGLATCFCLSGQLALQQGDAAMARSLVEEGLLLYREIGGWEEGIGESLSVLGKVAAVQGDYTGARAFYKESLTFPGEMDAVWIASSLEGLAGVVAVQRDSMWAGWLYGAAEALRESVGTPLPLVERTSYERSVAAARAQLGEQAFATAWAEGRTMTPEQALAAERQPIQPTPTSAARPTAPYPDGLTAREVEVLRLLAQGLTSAQIAEQLVISVVTVNFHVRSIYSKLGVSSRAAATRYALEHHLV